MNIIINYPQPFKIDELYAHYITGNDTIALDKRDVNTIVLHAKELLSLSATGEGEQAICEAFNSLSSALKQEDVSSINKVLIKIVCKGGIFFGDKEKQQLETFMNKFKPDTFFSFGLDENKSSCKDEVIISLLASITK